MLTVKQEHITLYNAVALSGVLDGYKVELCGSEAYPTVKKS